MRGNGIDRGAFLFVHVRSSDLPQCHQVNNNGRPRFEDALQQRRQI
jgi:hypothetical protein